MLSAVLRSNIAIEVSIKIIDSFVEMRKFMSQNTLLFQKIDVIAQKQQKTDERLEKLLSSIEQNDIKPKQGIFFNGQIFDAYVLMSSLIKEAKKSIVLIDNYVDETTLVHLSNKAAKGVSITILTKVISKGLKLDLRKHNQQYTPIEVKQLKHSHDRFLLIDEKIYHLGASLKDLGKKWFAFSLIEEDVFELKKKIGEVLNAD
jgi:sugar-specific transcriptional regulator TrmB